MIFDSHKQLLHPRSSALICGSSGALPHDRGVNGRGVLIQFGILVALTMLLFRNEIAYVLPRLIEDSEAAHALAAPVLIALLLWQRREVIRNSLAPGSVWGLLFFIAAGLMYALATWPFNYSYPRQAAIIVALSGCILTVAGWRVLQRCTPMLIILLLAVPIGHRQYAGLIVRPETITLQSAEQVLNMLPNVMMRLEGLDIHFMAQDRTGVIGLGDPHRGASLFLSFLSLGVFVTFLRIRPMWQIAIVAALAMPIAFAANLMRVLLHGAFTIYGDYTALHAAPRMLSAAIALILAYLAFVLLLWILQKAVVPEDHGTTGRTTQPDAAS